MGEDRQRAEGGGQLVEVGRQRQEIVEIQEDGIDCWYGTLREGACDQGLGTAQEVSGLKGATFERNPNNQHLNENLMGRAGPAH